MPVVGAGGSSTPLTQPSLPSQARLKQLVQWPLAAPQLCARLGLGGPRGLLLYGPPGTGKTMLVRALAAESRLNLLAVPIPQLIRPAVGASERALAALFEHARAHRPCLVFLDELQAASALLLPALSALLRRRPPRRTAGAG